MEEPLITGQEGGRLPQQSATCYFELAEEGGRAVRGAWAEGGWLGC